MVRRPKRVELRDFLGAEVPQSSLSPDLRQRVRHALAGHGELRAVAVAVVRELLERGLLRVVGSVREGADLVPLYGLPHSARAYDLRRLLEEDTPEPVSSPGGSEPEQSEDPDRSARATPSTGPALTQDSSALEAIRRTLERDWVSFGLDASLETLLDEIARGLDDQRIGLMVFDERSGLRSQEGRGWAVCARDDERSQELRRALQLGAVEAGHFDERRWHAVRAGDEIVAALGTSAQVDARRAEEAALTIAELLLAFRRSQQRVHTDPLTGLHNRGFFETQLSIELERSRRLSQPLALLFADLDHFKNVNDTYGHEAGDRVLQQVSQQMVQHLRRIDQVFRWGGEEFALLLPGTAMDEAIHTAERIRAVVEATPVVLDDGRTLSCTISIGIALAPQHAQGGERALLRHADQALYRAKAAGRNRVLVFQD